MEASEANEEASAVIAGESSSTTIGLRSQKSSAISAKMSSKASSKSSKKSRRRRVVPEGNILEDVSQEDLLRAMLGYKNTAAGAMQPYLYREDFCACCGSRHMAPALLDIYFMCLNCNNTLREPIKLRMIYEIKLQDVPLEILFATYGDAFDGSKAIDVTDKCREKVIELGGEYDRIAFKAFSNMKEYFGSDPAPGVIKQLKIRYRMDNIFGTVIMNVGADNIFPDWVLLARPKIRNLRLLRASYGHPKGLTPQGRMSFEVSELVQGLMDLAGGSYLNISTSMPISTLFGDPCPGYPKDIRIEFEVMSTHGEDTYDVIRGHLRRRIHIEATPIVAPIILIRSATYGITPVGRQNRLKHIAEELRQINIIEHKLREHVEVKQREKQLLEKKPLLIEERKLFQNVEVNFIDVTKKLQVLADRGTRELVLDKDTFDPNASFGNPSKGIIKLLEINLECQGHDSERRTDNREITSDAQVRNFITTKNASISVVVRDDQYGRGVMAENVEFHTDTSAPYVLINRATYGILDNMAKCVDVTMELQALVTGRILRVCQDVNLDKVFSKDPALGLRKQLKFSYTTLGFRGNLRVRERDDLFVAGIQLGYPPVPPRDEYQDYAAVAGSRK